MPYGMQSSRHNWDATGNVSYELDMGENDPNSSVYNLSNDVADDPILQKLAPLLYKLGGYAELVIEFNSKGYHDPGSMYGGSDNLGYAPESSDERSLASAYLLVNGQQHPLPDDFANELYDHFSRDIERKELESNGPDEPDYDDERPFQRSRYVESKTIDSLAKLITEDPNDY